MGFFDEPLEITLEKLNWEIFMYQNIILLLKKPDKAKLTGEIIINQKTHEIVGSVYNHKGEVLVTWSKETDRPIDIQRMVTSKMEAYMSGMARGKEIGEIYRRHKI